MDSQGTVVVRLSTSSALIPLQGATVTITKTRPDGTQELLAVRVTNFDGLVLRQQEPDRRLPKQAKGISR